MKRLLATAAAIWLAASPALAATDAVCQAVAAGARSLAPAPYDASSDLIAPPLQRIAAERGSTLSLDQSDALTSDQVGALAATLTRRFQASPAVLKAVDGLDPGDGSVWLRRLGGANVYAVEVMAGTMDCEDFAFFATPPGKSAKLVAAPPQLAAARNDVGSFCATAEGLLGAVGKTPVFIDQGWDPIEPTYVIAIAAWRGSGWAKPCVLRVAFRSSYRVAGVDCHGAVCAALPAAAADMAARREAQIQRQSVGGNPPAAFVWGPALSAADRARVEQAAALIGSPSTLDPPSVASASQHGFGDDAVVFPAVIGGQAYAAVLSHGSIGWRVYPDFLLALYDLKADAAERVATVEIAREVGPVQSITSTPWKP
jgi:hypothetical protein